MAGADGDRPVVLVTGGAGYVGSHACKALSLAGYVPVAFDNLVYGHRWAVKWGPFEHGDVNDRARLHEVFRTYRPVAIMHFAAYAYVGESVDDPAKYFRNNVSGTLNLLDEMRSHEIQRLVFSSTCATYGMPHQVPIAEDHPQDPINPYGASKLMVERILADYQQAYQLDSVSLRYFNAAGADPDGEIGEVHEPETHLIPLVLDTAMGRRPSITVFGDDYETSDGTCIRDYIHVSDLAQAHVLALDFMGSQPGCHRFNLGNGEGFSVKKVIDVATEVTGRNIPVQIGPRRPGDPGALVGDASRARRELGWSPTHSSIEEIIATAWSWHQRSFPRDESPASFPR